MLTATGAAGSRSLAAALASRHRSPRYRVVQLDQGRPPRWPLWHTQWQSEHRDGGGSESAGSDSESGRGRDLPPAAASRGARSHCSLRKPGRQDPNAVRVSGRPAGGTAWQRLAAAAVMACYGRWPPRRSPGPGASHGHLSHGELGRGPRTSESESESTPPASARRRRASPSSGAGTGPRLSP